jgi:probable HAF family extracellular repeat protein
MRAVFNRPRAGSCRRRGSIRGRLESRPRPESLEDRRLLSYAVIDLGSLGGTTSVPLALNNRGEVVGYSLTANGGPANAFLYSRGRMTDLGTLGGAASEAISINDRGEIVGTSNVASGSAQVDAFLERGGKLTDLGPLGHTFLHMVSINDAGAIAGLPAGGGDATVFRQGKTVDIGSLAGQGSVAYGMNDRGQVVGISTIGYRPASNSSSPPIAIYHAFLYGHGTMKDLGTLGGMVSFASFVNDRGSVVGFSDTANDAALHAFVDTHGKMTDLGTLGGHESGAGAINNEGVVVGFAQTSPSTTASHGFIDRHGRMIDLNTLIPANSGVVITSANDINDRGQIVADGYATSSPTVQLALLLDPKRSAG